MSSPYRENAKVEQEKPQPFPLEKILTVSARDYCESVGNNLGDYKLVGIHIHSGNSKYMAQDVFRERIPTGTEVIVSYQIAYVGFNFSVDVSGTALIPK